MKTIARITLALCLITFAEADQWGDEFHRQHEQDRQRQQADSDRWKAERERQQRDSERRQAENDRLQQEERIRRLEDRKWRDRE
jgi:hypothetical protein